MQPYTTGGPLLRHMLATHVNPHNLVIACTCPSAMQSATSAFFSKLPTGKTTDSVGRTLTTTTTQQLTEHTNHSTIEDYVFLALYQKVFKMSSYIIFSYSLY